MNWNDIKTDNQKVYPTESITVFMMDTDSGKPETHWVNKGYEQYAYKKQCPFNCFVTVDFNDDFNATNLTLDVAEIEALFKNKLREVCVCHIVARTTTDTGINIEYYIDDVERAIAKFTEIEQAENQVISFDCEIIEDEDWDNVAVLFE